MSEETRTERAEETSVKQPRVTVLMPAYNVSKYIDESIQSVLSQTYQDWELLIVNDCSTDDTVERIEQYGDPRIRLVHTPQNLKLCRALNYGLQHCRGEFVARLDSDDNATPNRLELQVEALDRNPKWALVGGWSNTIDSHGNVTRRWEDCFLPSDPAVIKFTSMFKNTFRHSSVTFRRSVVEGLGGYPVEWHDVEDYGLWTKLLSKKLLLANLAVPLCDYRVHSNSMMTNASELVSQTKSEPRRPTVQEIYVSCARNMGASEELAQRWGRLWAQVRLPIAGENVDIGLVKQTLKEILSLGVFSQELERQATNIRIFAYMQLIHAANRQNSYLQAFKAMLSAGLAVGPVKFLKACFNNIVLRK